jgi:thiol-disulfide isomerase/thioredoxin
MKLVLIQILFLFSFFNFFGQNTNNKISKIGGYQISGTITGMGKSEVFLAHYFGANQQVIKDTVFSDESGHFLFKGTEDLPEGLYLISFLKNKYLDFIIGEKQFSFETDTLDLIGKMKVYNSINNSQFYLFQKEMSERISKVKSTDPSKLSINELNELRNSIKSFQNSWLEKNKNLLTAQFIKATLEPEIPPFNKLLKSAKDSLDFNKYQFNYYKSHYFDNFNLNDDRFLRSPFLQKKIEKYFEDLVVQESDSIAYEADRILSKIKSTDMRRYVVYKIASTYENSNIVGTDGAFVYLAEKYYIGEPELWDTSTVRRMKERIKIIKPLVNGKRIPEMFLTNPEGKEFTIASLVGNYSIIFIYDPECNHCKEETPKLLALNGFFKAKNVSVLAVSMERDKAKWLKFISEFKISSFVNGIDIHKNPSNGKEEFYTDFRNSFDVYSTPTVFILDKSKRIIGKRIPVDKIKEYIEFYEKKVATFSSDAKK